MQFSSAVIKRPLLKRQPDTLTSSNKDFKALITNYNNNNKVLLSTSSFVSFPVSSLFVSSFTTKNHGNKRKSKDNDTKRKKDSCVTEKIEMKVLNNNSSNSTTTKQLIKIEEQVKTKNKKNDDADIPIYLWLDKMNTFETISITKEEWNTSAVTIQEMFLLPRWRRNIMRCFARWLRSRLIESGVDEELTPSRNYVITSNGITSKAGNLYR